MGKMCAPVRDEKIQELTQTKDVIPVFKGILEASSLSNCMFKASK